MYSIYCCVGIFIMIIFIISFIVSTLPPATRVKREKFQPPKSTILSKPWWVKTPNTHQHPTYGGHVRVKNPPKFTAKLGL